MRCNERMKEGVQKKKLETHQNLRPPSNLRIKPHTRSLPMRRRGEPHKWDIPPPPHLRPRHGLHHDKRYRHIDRESYHETPAPPQDAPVLALAVGQDEHDVVERCGGGEEERGGDAYADGGYAGVPVVDLEERYEDAEDDAGELC